MVVCGFSIGVPPPLFRQQLERLHDATKSRLSILKQTTLRDLECIEEDAKASFRLLKYVYAKPEDKAFYANPRMQVNIGDTE